MSWTGYCPKMSFNPFNLRSGQLTSVLKGDGIENELWRLQANCQPSLYSGLIPTSKN